MTGEIFAAYIMGTALVASAYAGAVLALDILRSR